MGDTAIVYFDATAAHAFVIGSALFGIFWGVFNVLLVRKVNITDSSIVLKALNE
jgi:hypothetical protein